MSRAPFWPRRLVRGAGLSWLATLLALGAPALQAEEYTGHRLGASSHVAIRALQELLRRDTQPHRGEIFLAIPEAMVLGHRTAYQAFCMPRIQIINSASETVGELIFGVRYEHGGGSIGSTVTRVARLEAGREVFDEAFHESLRVDSCQGLTGSVEVVRCVYVDGHDCTADVRPLAFGTVPLRPAGGSTIGPAAALPLLRPGLQLQRVPPAKEEKK